MKRNISNKIKYFNWVLTIGMVMYHSRPTDGYNLIYKNIIDEKLLHLYMLFSEHIGFVCMTFFFFMSGFWFYRNLFKIKDIIKKYKKRIKTLLIPFLLWTILILIYKQIMGEININFNMNNIIYYFFYSPIAGPLWYLLSILILQLLAPILVLSKKNKYLSLTLFSSIIIYVILRNFGFIDHLIITDKWWWYENMIYYIPAYLFGACMGLNCPKKLLEKEYNKKKHFYIGCLLITISLLLWYFARIYEYYIFYSLIEISGFWLLLNNNLFKKDFSSIFSGSFFIYALHNPIMIPLTRKCIFKLLNGVSVCGISIILIKIIQLIIIVVSSYIIKFICKHIFSDKIYQGLTGGR